MMDARAEFRLGRIVLVLLVVTAGMIVTEPVYSIDVHGYVEPSYGVRYDDDGPVDDRNSLLETRAILKTRWYGKQGESLNVRVLANQAHNRDGDVDIREGSVFLPLSRDWELSVGRQVLSWGPAQYEFINDHFAKDYKSFFLGRDLEFLKAPNDGVKISRFGDVINANLVFTPEFDPDRTPTGREIPVFHPGLGRLVESDSLPTTREPDDSVDNGELHLRLYKTIGRWEVSAYGYRGFTGTPVGWLNGVTFHPELSSGGLSLRGPYRGSVVWLESSYDDIRHSLSGDTTGVPPDRGHLMLGMRYRTAPTVSYMLQGTVSRQFNGEDYRELLPANKTDSDRNRYRLQGATTRTYWQDRLELEARGFLGITEDDWHLRLSGSYEWSDAIHFTLGSLLYGADRPSTRFGALEDHDLIYTRLRYSF